LAAVENLWTDGANPVENTRGQVFSRQEVQQLAAQTRQSLRLRPTSLVSLDQPIESSLLRYLSDTSPADTTWTVATKKKSPAARHIRITPCHEEQWRIAGAGQACPALMPFCRRRELAARELTNWLSLVSASRPR
jgi:hypothetical protein